MGKGLLTYYDLLEIDSDSDARAIRRAYVAQIRRYHPDNCRENAEYSHYHSARINEAYRILGDPLKRSSYDAALARFQHNKLRRLLTVRGRPAVAGAPRNEASAVARPVPAAGTGDGQVAAPAAARLSGGQAALGLGFLAAATLAIASWPPAGSPVIPSLASPEQIAEAVPDAAILPVAGSGIPPAPAAPARTLPAAAAGARAGVDPGAPVAFALAGEAHSPAPAEAIAPPSPPPEAAPAPVVVRPIARQPVLAEAVRTPPPNENARPAEPVAAPQAARSRSRQKGASASRACFDSIVAGPDVYRACLRSQGGGD